MEGERGLATGISARLSPLELKRFGFTIVLPLALLAAVINWRGHTILPAVLAGLAAMLAGLALLAPKLLRPVHILWMGLVNALGWLNTRLLLGLVYFLVITPIGVVMRFVGRDPLDRQLRDRSSYWVDRNPHLVASGSMERQF